MQIDFVTIDVFSRKIYEGNPLALVLIKPEEEKHITQELKQKIAREFNLSETAFLHLSPTGAHGNSNGSAYAGAYPLDIFMTDAELPFAGHPTIGAAYYVMNVLGGLKAVGASLVTKSGPIEVERFQRKGVSASISHNVHVHSNKFADLEKSDADAFKKYASSIPEIVAAEKESTTRLVSIVKGMTFLCSEVSSLGILGKVKREGKLNISPTGGALDKGWDTGFVGKYYYCFDGQGEGTLRDHFDRNGEEHTFGKEKFTKVRTRMIEQNLEDPATGSAASALSCFLALKAQEADRDGKTGQTTLYEITQGVEMGRKSVIYVEVKLKDDSVPQVESVKLSGEAVLVQQGKLELY